MISFLRECGAFFLLTVDEGRPCGRPFGAVMQREDELFLSTSREKAVFRQIEACPQVQLLALRPGTRQWVRLSGTARECADSALRQAMLEECPALQKRFASADDPHYALLRVQVTAAEQYE